MSEIKRKGNVKEVESLIQQLNDNEEANWDELNKLFLQTLEIEALSTLGS